MNIKLDENLPRSLAQVLQAFGHDVLTVYDQSLQGRSDREVWQVVVQEQRFLITQDVEFGDLRKYPLGSHAGIMLLRLQSPDRERIIQVVQEIFRQEPVEAWRGGLAIVSDYKLRLLLPEGAP